MYSEVVNGLGLSQNTLEVMVLIGLGIFICGVILVLFWKHIIVGALALSCVVVMANHKSPMKNQPVDPVVENNSLKPVGIKCVCTNFGYPCHGIAPCGSQAVAVKVQCIVVFTSVIFIAVV